MRCATGVVNVVQEGRFSLVTDDGRVLHFVLAHNAAAEPQDLPPLQAARARVRVDYSDSDRVIAGIAKRIRVEE